MAVEVYTDKHLRARVLAGLVLAVRVGQSAGADARFLAGALAMAEHDALTFALDWPAILADARDILGADCQELLDGALALGDGGDNA